MKKAGHRLKVSVFNGKGPSKTKYSGKTLLNHKIKFIIAALIIEDYLKYK